MPSPRPQTLVADCAPGAGATAFPRPAAGPEAAPRWPRRARTGGAGGRGHCPSVADRGRRAGEAEGERRVQEERIPGLVGPGPGSLPRHRRRSGAGGAAGASRGGGGAVRGPPPAALVGTDIQPNATGLTTFRAQSTTRGLEVAVDAVDLTDTVWVLVNGDIVAQITIIATRGGGGIETCRGDDVPDVQSGDLIEIADADGNVLLWGVF